MSFLSIIVILFILAIIVVAVILILSLTRMQQRKLVKSFSIEVANRGNARSRFELWAEDQTHELAFEFILNGGRLGQAQTADANAPVGQNLLANGSKPPQVRTAQSMKAAAQNAGDKVSGFSETIGGILDTLGSLLPGSAGSAITALSYRLRGGQAAVARTQRVTAQAKGLAGIRPQGSSYYSSDDGNAGMPGTTNGGGALDNGTAAAVLTHPQTAFVEPGKQLQLSLMARPVGRLKSEQVPFKLYSKSLESQGPSAISQDGMAVFKGMTGVMLYVPQIIVGAVALILVIVLLAVTRILG